MRLGGFFDETFSTPQEWVAILRVKGYRAAYAPFRIAPGGDFPRLAEVRAYRMAAEEADILIAEAGSMAARVRRGQRTRYAYCASKATLNIQSILLQNHAAEYGIRVHRVEPGWLRTFLASKEKCTIAPTEPEESAQRMLTFVERTPPDYMFHDLFEDRSFDW
jgi:NAD(P)-dependent dehydrogenase (short-subunit alcohol dehydrogenase family)